MGIVNQQTSLWGHHLVSRKKDGSGFPGILRTGQMTNQDWEKSHQTMSSRYSPQNVDLTVEHGGCLKSLGTSNPTLVLSLFTRPGKHTKSYKKW